VQGVVGNFATKLVAMATSLEILKKNSDLSSTPKTLSYGVKIAKITHGLCFACDIKLDAMTTFLKESDKMGRIETIHANTFHLVKKIVKIDSFAHSKKTRNAW